MHVEEEFLRRYSAEYLVLRDAIEEYGLFQGYAVDEMFAGLSGNITSAGSVVSSHLLHSMPFDFIAKQATSGYILS